jgi:hypothetical protein
MTFSVFHSTTVGDMFCISTPPQHVSYCCGVEIQNMSPTVVEWNKVDVTYCGGVVIQNMSPTVVE